MKKTVNDQQPSLVRRVFRHYYAAARRHKWALLVNIIVPMLAVAFGSILFRYYLAVLFAQLGQLDQYSSAAIWGTFYVLLALIFAEVFFWRVNDYTFIRRQAKLLRDLEQRTFNKLLAHSYRFFSDNFAGSLTTQYNRFLKSIELIEDAVEFDLLTSATQIVFATVVLLFIAPPLALALIVWVIVFLGVITWLSVKKSRITRIAAAADSMVTANAADSITNVLNIKAFARHDHELQRFKKTSEDRYDKRYHSWLYSAHIRSVRWAFMIIFNVMFLVLSIHLVLNGSATLAAVLAAQLYVTMIANRLFDLNQTIERVEMAFSDASEMTEILDTIPEVLDPKRPEPVQMGSGLVEFQNVDFRYADAGGDVLTDFSLAIQPGQKVGLVGHSGSGKSTLTRLLMRFMDIQGGAITIDGQNIAQVRQEDLRANLAFVPQEPILFHRSLMENIRYGRPAATDQEVFEAARLAHAAEFINALPQGYETLVGERGVKLSGGEKQRVAIARAMLSRAPILILDEATSALDSKSEKLITDALNELMKHRTTLVIAHRLSTIRKLDRILVMKDGEIIEDGNHASLLKKKGAYAELWSHQSGGFIDD